VPPERARVVARSVAAALAADAREARRYTLLLADPPYAAWPAVQQHLAGALQRVLAPGGLAVVETARGEPIHLPLRALRVRRYGDTQVAVFIRDQNTAIREDSCPTR
jgi:16S rRNA G966 N2-methylase RsmD